jgi:hypothetical protein
MANNILIQWQGVAQTIQNIQNQLNALAASTLPALSAAVAGEFPIVNAAGTGYVLLTLSGDVLSSSSTPGQITVQRVQGFSVSPTAPTSAQFWLFNGTTFTPVSLSGDGTMSSAGVLTLTKFGGVTPAIVGGSGVSVTGTFPALTISATGVAAGFSNLSTITLGAAGSNTQLATIQLKDSTGANLAQVQKIEVYMATDAAGAVPSASGVSQAVTVTTGASLFVAVSKLYFNLVTTAAGVVALNFDNTGGSGPYTDRLVLVLPANQVVVSAQLFVQSTAYSTMQPTNLPMAAIQKPQWWTPSTFRW